MPRRGRLVAGRIRPLPGPRQHPGVLPAAPPVGGLTFLDLGRGEGHDTRLLAGQGARVAALDVGESFITAAAGQDRSRIRYTVGDGAALPFRASVFDVVTAFMTPDGRRRARAHPG